MQDNINFTSSQEIGFKNTGMGIRLLAYIIDNLILSITFLVINFLLSLITKSFDINILTNEILFQYTLSDIALYVIRCLYFVLLTYYTSATIGKHIFRIKVVPINESKRMTFIDILYRETIGRYLSQVILCVGYFMIWFTKDKLTLHDRLCDTKVVYKDKVQIKMENIAY